VVIRHAALGDMVLTRPFLVEARRFFPNAELVLSIVSNYSYGLPTDLVDSVHVLHGSDQPTVSLKDRIARARELKSIDILFDLADTTRSRYLCLLTDAKIKVGFPYSRGLRNLIFHAAVPRSDFSFEAINMLDALMLFGASPEIPLQFNWGSLPISNAIPPKSPYIIYFPFASVNSKCWNTENYLRSISLLAQIHPSHEHIILGGVGKNEALQPFEAALAEFKNIRFQRPLELDETLRLLSHARLVISNDTGIRNLAISLDVSSIGIFFATVPFRYWPRYGKHRALFNPDGSPPSVEDLVEAAALSLAES
jgi:ADP-heptose:LPS heptosyltransferase